jgi:hypothetical protein
LRVYCGFIEADNYINVKTSELNGLIENLQLRNSIITIGTTGINLGNTKTEIVGLTKLAIGTSSPTTILDVRSTDSYTQGLFQNNNATNPGHIIIRNESYNEQIQIRSRYDGEDNHIFTWNGSAMANLRLNTSMMLLGNGNVGIGVTNPTKKLTIYQDIGGYGEFNLTTNSQELLFGCDTLGGRSYIQSRTIAGVNNNLTLQPNGGNVGIGITSPVVKLDVYGSIVSRGTPADINKGIRLKGRNEDGASYTTYNGGLQSWQGIGFECTLDSTTRHMFNTRNGDFIMTGSLGIGASSPNYKLDLGQSYGNTNQASAKKLALYNNSDGNGFYGFGISASLLNFYADCSATGEPQMVLKGNGNVGIGYLDPQNKLEVLGDIKCGNPANTLTALDIDTNSSYSYGILIGGWSAGGRINGNATIEMSTNLHIDSASVGAILLNWYNAGNSTFIRNRIDVSDRRIKKDIVEIETPEQFTETFEIIKKVGGYKYKYRDIYRENDLDQYGFIAQEVLKHYPVACKSTGDNCYLPNIMKTLNFTYEVGEENQYTFTIEGYDLDVNIKYLFYGFKEGVEQFDYMENIEPTTNNTFTYTPTIIKNEEPPIYVKLVLVGTYTDDKLGVSKDKLFQLGFAGVRGLITENETLKSRIDILEEQNKKIIQKLNELISPDGWFTGLPP